MKRNEVIEILREELIRQLKQHSNSATKNRYMYGDYVYEIKLEDDGFQVSIHLINPYYRQIHTIKEKIFTLFMNSKEREIIKILRKREKLSKIIKDKELKSSDDWEKEQEDDMFAAGIPPERRQQITREKKFKRILKR